MKTITVKDENGKEYVLEFSKTTIMHMERQGFVIDDFGTKPVLMATLLVYGAFAKNHPNLKNEKIDAIYKQLKNKDVFLKKLAEMYTEQADELVDEGNSDWEANW